MRGVEPRLFANVTDLMGSNDEMKRRSTARWIGLAVVGFWIFMMGFLAYRELGGGWTRSATARSAAAEPAGRGETWMGLFVAGARVGHVHMIESQEERHDLPGIVQELEVRATLDVLGRVTELVLDGAVWRPREGTGAEFEFRVESGDYDFGISGNLADGLLSAEVVSAGEALPLKVPIDEEVVFSSGFGAAFEFPALAVGEEVRLDSFDPLTLRKSPVRVRCEAEEVIEIGSGRVATRRLDVLASGIRSRVWIDENGDVVKMTTPFGLTLQRIDSEELSTMAMGERILAGETGGGFLRASAVLPSGKRPFRGARRSLVRIVTESGETLPEDRVQRSVGEGKYLLSIPPEPATGVSKQLPNPDRYLTADAFVQSDHPEIREEALRIVGDETDPWRRALKIYRWVSSSIRKEPVVSIPSALEVLRKRRGDCNEHTVLFTALARAVSLPTRIAIGLVWSEDLDGFYYHAWPEVFVGGGWVWMDPTLGQPLADATHVKLLNGGIESWTGLVRHLGRLEIEVLEMD